MFIWLIIFTAYSCLSCIPAKAVQAQVPEISFVGIEHSPLVEGDKESFILSSKEYDGQVQYRVRLNKMGTNEWTDITNGYTAPVDSKAPWEVKYEKPFSVGHYNVSVWVKIAGTNGTKVSKDGRYDNLYTAYLNCVSKDPLHRVYADGSVDLSRETYVLGETVNIGGIIGISGMQGPYSYKLHVFNPTKADESNKGWNKNVTEYSTNGIQWKPKAAGTYVLDMWANVPDSKAMYEAWKLKVVHVEDAIIYDKNDAVIVCIVY
jgi:hypothetical protein